MNNQHELILAIDQGGQSSRVAIYTTSGECLHCFSAACATTHNIINGCEYIEQNPQEILSGIEHCLEQITQLLGDDVTQITAAGFAGQGSSLLCWDSKTGDALSPVLSWQDIRGEHYLRDIVLTHAQTQTLTGLRISPHYGATKIRWCLDNNEKVIHAQQHNSLSIGPIVNYIFWHLLTHRKISHSAQHQNNFSASSIIDPGHAQRTLLWNLQKNQWDDNLLALFNIPKSILPTCACHNSHFGDLQLNKHRIPFTASARDQGASLFARGLPDKSAIYTNIGTGAFIQRVSENLQAPEGLLVSPLWIPGKNKILDNDIELSSPTCYLAEFINDLIPPSLYAWEATVNGAASATNFIQQQTGLLLTPQEINTALNLQPNKTCYFLNAIGGLSAPYWRTDLQSSFSENLSPHEKILAWLESVIFQITVNVQLMNKRENAGKIYISGGLSNADALCQKLADLTRINVIRSDNADATLQGIAHMATGLNNKWAPATHDDVFLPEPNQVLLNRFYHWQDAMKIWLNEYPQ